MRFSPSFLDELKARLPVSQVVGRRVRLIKAGREWKGLSPFNAEKTPSFFVNDQKQAWFDFSSGKNGNIFDFVIESEGLSFPEAVERLASEAGLALPARSADMDRQEKKRASLVEVMEMAALYFEMVYRGGKGRTARDYLARRGVSDATRAEFRIGYASPERHGLRDHLAEKGVDIETMVGAGLLISGADIPVAYDRFRDRVMFPIHDARGRVIAFGGRALSPDASAKYLNSPETDLFNKGSVLFNHHRARKATHEKDRVVAVEGYMDAIAMSAAGFAETVAPLGTALTEEQLALLWRMADEPILCFDGDKAGQRAAFRAVDLALAKLQAGKSVRFAFLSQGQDPDDLLRAEGPAAMEFILAAARPLSDVLWMRESTAGPIDTPERRAAMERRLRETVASIGDPLTRRYYEANVAEKLDAFAPRPRNRPFERRRDASSGRQSKEAYRAPPPSAPSLGLRSAATFSGTKSGAAQEALIVLGLDARRELLVDLAEELSSLALTDPDARLLARSLLDDHAFEDDARDKGAESAGEELSASRERLRRRLPPGDDLPLKSSGNLARLEMAIRQAIGLHDQARALRSEQRDAERVVATEETEAAMAWLRDVHERLSALQQMPASLDTVEEDNPLARAIANAPVARRS